MKVFRVLSQVSLVGFLAFGFSSFATSGPDSTEKTGEEIAVSDNVSDGTYKPCIPCGKERTQGKITDPPPYQQQASVKSLTGEGGGKTPTGKGSQDKATN